MVFAIIFFVGLANGGASETRQHGSHVHGIGKLNVALAGKTLHIELKSPAANILGFEHAPETEQQTHAVEKAIKLLKEGEKLFTLPAKAQCILQDTHVDSDIMEGHHKEHEAHHQEHEDSHSEEDHVDGSGHSEFEVTYHFECGNPDSLKDIDVLLFSHFPGFEEIDVQLLSPTRQTAVELTSKKFQLSL